MTIEQLRVIAAAVRAVTQSPYATVELGDEGVARLRVLGARTRTTVYANDNFGFHKTPYVIEAAELEVDGVKMHAQTSRNATEEEAARLTEAVPHGGPMVAVTL